jgi:hypothetical protein
MPAARATRATRRVSAPGSKAIAAIAAFTAAGQLPQLREALTDGLDAGLSIAEINEILIQMYALRRFPAQPAFEMGQERVPFLLGGRAVFLAGSSRSSAADEGSVGLDGFLRVYRLWRRRILKRSEYVAGRVGFVG